MEIIKQYLELVENLEVFHKPELVILERVLRDYMENKDGYVVIDERIDDKILGFVIFGRIPLTVNGWDIYWMAVGKEYQGQGLGRRLIKRVEEHILQVDKNANIRVETSTRTEYAHARNLYSKSGFLEVGRIRDFYEEGDDVIILYKNIHLDESSSSEKM